MKDGKQMKFCICAICVAIIFLTWRTEALKTRINRLEEDLSFAKREIRRLKERK